MPIDPVGYTCVCKRHNGGHPHAVSRSAWYKHLRAAETEEERATIRAGNLSLDLHAQIRAHTDALGESSSSTGPSRNVVTDAGSRLPERLDEAAQGSHVREHHIPTPSSPHGEQRGLVDEDPIIPMGDEDPDFNMQDDGNLDGPGDGDIGGQRDGNLDGWGDDGRRDKEVHSQMLPAPQHDNRRERPAIDIEELAQRAVLPKIKMTMEFILALRSASLGDPVAKLDEEARSNLRNPPREPPDITNPIIRHSISTYYALEHSSQSAYERIRSSTARTFPDTDEMPSFYRIERMIAEYTGVESITHDMCPDTCIAFTGPFADLDRCPFCNKHRYDQIKLQASRGRIKVARKFHTIPAGPQLQALYRDRDSAKRMRYRTDLYSKTIRRTS
ncbi:hypothetical protein DFH29DRAFT_35339 [Suillus ampliporus]|nr:hypothetical protein DFH29DRAFT_35339 [Suillus ampliporus]